MRKLILTALLVCVGILTATTIERYQETGQNIYARMENVSQGPVLVKEFNIDEGDTAPLSTTLSKTFAFPYQNIDLIVNHSSWKVYDKQGNYIRTISEQNNPVSISKIFTFREMRGVTVNVQTQVETDNEIRTLDNVDYSLSGSGQISIPNTISPAFVDAYRALADNWDTSYLRNVPVSRPKMLIISHSQLASYQAEFIKWKRSLGFDVYVINKSTAGNSVQEIRNTILAHYQQYKCDYLFLWGDTVGTYSIPTNYYPSPEYAENDADDNYYALLEGEDYFPEMLVGRFSFTDPGGFVVLTSKTISYEKEPFMADTSWMRRALTVAGNYAEGNLRPTTPVLMSRWLRDKMLLNGYAQVDTVYYPGVFPGTSLISASINRGVQLISYRGWGDVNGWHYPRFQSSDLNDKYNGYMMPIVFSIVCNTGDFANSVNPSFGEKWMLMNTAESKGCIAFVGPSDLHTKTRLNNSISSGAFRSILEHGVRSFGSSVLLGKMELYKNFPSESGTGQYVPFYFHVYNVLSDPSLNMWISVPGVISEDIIESGLTFAQSSSHIRINAPHLDGAIVSGTKNGTSFTYTKVVDGVAILNIDPEQTGDLVVTVSKPNWVPLVRTLTPSVSAGIGVSANNAADQLLNALGTFEAEITLKNYANVSYSNVTASFNAGEHITITPINGNTFSLAPGASHTLQIQIQADHTIRPEDVITFTLNLQNPTSTHQFQMTGGGARVFVLNHTGILNIGAVSQISFSCTNSGTSPMNNAVVNVVSLTEAATIPMSQVSIGDIGIGETRDFSVNITLPVDTWEGRNIPLKFIVSNGTGYEWMSFYSLTAGTPGTDDPTGPCEYGYFAYDNTDLGHAMKPDYEWTEIDPLQGGSGSLWLIKDDGVKQVSLPFTFRFYGRDYNSITISSNGWISFVPSNEDYFNNHFIPAALGPYAMVAGYWDDLKGMKTGVDSLNNDVFADMRILYWHDSANNRYIVQWNDAYNQYNIQAGQNASLEKFQIILYPLPDRDGDIIVQYHTVDNPGITTNYCTVGIEDHRQLTGLTYTYSGAYPSTASILAPGRAIRFTTTAPDNYVSNDDPVVSLPIVNLRNFPNPFNPTTTISFENQSSANAILTIYNTKGQLIKSLFNGPILKGTNNVVWDGTDNNGKLVSTGVYMYRMHIGDQVYNRKMLLMK